MRNLSRAAVTQQNPSWFGRTGNPLPYLNAAHYENPKVYELFRRAAAEVDEAERAEEFKEIQTIVGSELPVFATVALPTVVAAGTRVHGLLNSINLTSGDFSQT